MLTRPCKKRSSNLMMVLLLALLISMSACSSSVGSQLIEAAKNGETEKIETLLDQSARVNTKDTEDQTALMWAAAGGHTDTVRVLLDAGASVNSKSKAQVSALMLAADGGYIDTVQALLDAGAEVNPVGEAESALIMAVRKGHTRVAVALLGAGANAGLLDRRGRTALMIAANEDHLDLVSALIEHDAEQVFVAAKTFMESGRASKAQLVLEKALELKPDSVLAYEHLGFAHRAMGRYDQAVAAHSKAVELNPESVFYRRQLAFDLLGNGDHERARKEYRQALKLNPDDAAVHCEAGFSSLLQDRYREALREFKKCSEKTDLPSVYRVIWQSLALKHVGKDGEARRMLKDQSQQLDGAGWPAVLLQYHEGRIEESELISRASNENQECEAYFYVACLALLTGDQEKALKSLRKVLETEAFENFEYVGARVMLEQLEAK